MDEQPDLNVLAEELTTAIMENRSNWLKGLINRGLGFEAEDALTETHLKMLEQLSATRPDDPEGLADVVSRWSNPKYVWQTLHRNALQLRRKRLGTVPKPGGGRTHAPWTSVDAFPVEGRPDERDVEMRRFEPLTPDDVPDYLDRVRARACLRGVLMVLVDRSVSRPGGTFVSADQYHSYRAAAAAAAEGSDAPLQEAADLLGLKAATVRQHVRRLQLAVLATRYTVGVLGGPRWLRSPGRINLGLDRFDGHLTRVSKARLLTASACVATNLDTGTRVAADRYVITTAAFAGPEAVAELHDEETAFGLLIEADQTNCVTRCAPHNPVPDRVTEF